MSYVVYTYLQADICVLQTLLSQVKDGEILTTLFKIDFTSCFGSGSTDAK